MTRAPLVLSRRAVLAGSGALLLSFSTRSLWAQSEGGQQTTAQPSQGRPGSLKDFPYLDAWIRIDANGAVTVFTGKAELGQGIATAVLQVAAEELEVPVTAVNVITADTSRTPDEGYTAGSQSMPESATAVRHAAAQAREILIAEAARRAGVGDDQLRAENGAIVASDGRRFLYGELVSGTLLHVEAQTESKLKSPKTFKVIGTSVPRLDIPAKVTGQEAYVHDLRPEGMVHARVVRPPSYRATLSSVNIAAAEAMPGVIRVVRDGSFLGVVAEREWQAIKAMRALAASAQWQEQASLPSQSDLPAAIRSLKAETATIHEARGAPADASKTLEATFTKPYIMHGSIGPSCAVALADGNGGMTIWSHTQGVFPDRDAIAEMLGVQSERIRVVHVDGSGCYGHNGADDAAADAALIARAVPGRPVRVQWMREQENAWEPFGAAMVTHVGASLDDSGRITDWEYSLWSNPHSTRPGPAGSLIAARHLAKPFSPPAPRKIPLPSGGGSRNSVPLYTIPNARVIQHFIPEMPIRVSALRALGGYMNVFAVESFMDELAAAANIDAVAFRLRHLDDPRARAVITATAERFNWRTSGSDAPNRGYGFGFARYKNLAAYCAVAVEVEITPATGRVRLIRVASTVDAGQVVNPDGLINQTEGGILQSASWTLYEHVSFDDTRITSIDWSTYPILRFNAVPERIDVEIINRPNQPFLGSGEAVQGPVAGAIANAVSRVLGVRVRDLPLTHERIRALAAI